MLMVMKTMPHTMLHEIIHALPNLCRFLFWLWRFGRRVCICQFQNPDDCLSERKKLLTKKCVEQWTFEKHAVTNETSLRKSILRNTIQTYLHKLARDSILCTCINLSLLRQSLRFCWVHLNRWLLIAANWDRNLHEQLRFLAGEPLVARLIVIVGCVASRAPSRGRKSTYVGSNSTI